MFVIVRLFSYDGCGMVDVGNVISTVSLEMTKTLF